MHYKLRLALCLFLCAALLLSVPACAENSLEKYEQLLTGTWKVIWRYIPAVSLSNLSDPMKPVNIFRYPGEFAKAGMTVTSYLTGDDTGAVYLVLTTAGSSHGIVSFDGGYEGRISLSSDGNLLTVEGIGGSVLVYRREEE